MINIDKIFNLFTESPNPDKPTQLVDYKHTPGFWINMIIKKYKNKKTIIKKNTFNGKNITSNYPEDLDINELLEYSKQTELRIYYISIYCYFNKINILNKMHVDCIYLFSNKSFFDACQDSIEYWEGFEEYEKCHLIKNIQDLVKSNLIS